MTPNRRAKTKRCAAAGAVALLVGCHAGGLEPTDEDDAGQDMSRLDSGRAPDLGQTMPPDQGAGCLRCAKFAEPQSLGKLPKELTETSGLAASHVNAGVLYSHNDSGGGPRFYALSQTGELLATISLPGVTMEDTEDIAVGPCPTGSCVYLGDIGDNAKLRTSRKVVRVTEPVLKPGETGQTLTATNLEALPFSYPGDVRNNAETLMVHPQTGDIYVGTKEAAGVRSTLFKFPQPLTPGQSVVLARVAELPIPKPDDQDLSGGDIQPCGGAVLLRTGNRLYLLPVMPGQSFESVFSPPSADSPYVLEVPAATEDNGESVAWSSDGKGYFTASEGAGQQLHGVACAPTLLP